MCYTHKSTHIHLHRKVTITSAQKIQLNTHLEHLSTRKRNKYAAYTSFLIQKRSKEYSAPTPWLKSGGVDIFGDKGPKVFSRASLVKLNYQESNTRQPELLHVRASHLVKKVVDILKHMVCCRCFRHTVYTSFCAIKRTEVMKKIKTAR